MTEVEPTPADLSPPPVPSEPSTAALSTSVEEKQEPRISGEEWLRPRRIALIVAFALSLALFFGTAAALLRIPNALPVSALLALVGGLAEIVPLLPFVTGFERRTISVAPFLLVSVGGGLESYFVGGTVGVGSPSTLGAAAIAIVLYLMLGHRARESPRRRIRRVRRWARNAAVLGAVLLLVAGGLYFAYVNTPPLPSIAAGTLQENAVLLPGQHVVASATLNGAAGDLLFVLLAASNTTVPVEGTLLNSAGAAMANLTAGNFTSPSVVYLELRVDPGVYTLKVTYPSQPGGPSLEQVRWTAGDIPAAVQAETGAALSAGWVGFGLLIVGITLWIMSRPPEEPEAAVQGGPASPSPPSSPEAGGTPPEQVPPAPPEGGSAPVPSTSSSGTTGVEEETSDKERT